VAGVVQVPRVLTGARTRADAVQVHGLLTGLLARTGEEAAWQASYRCIGF
jgi:uncharacterized protein YgfB (UPF0149 family)